MRRWVSSKGRRDVIEGRKILGRRKERRETPLISMCDGDNLLTYFKLQNRICVIDKRPYVSDMLCCVPIRRVL